MFLEPEHRQALVAGHGYGKLFRMKILAVDIGTGTQDILLYNSSLDMENNYKLILPSPTMMVRWRVNEATLKRLPILLTGVTMGGGPSTWAVENHLREGLDVYATVQAARTFNDDLEAVQEMGIRVVSDDEAQQLPSTTMRIRLCDFNFTSIASAFNSFGVQLDDLDAVAVAVFDHGNAPAGVSDRKFRFEYLDERIRAQNRLSGFAFRSNAVPERMTRLQAIVQSAQGEDFPLVVMDTAPAAVLGATLDAQVASQKQVLVANLGNFHTLAFRMGPEGIEGLFEHHTGFLDREKLTSLLRKLADGSLRNQDVFNDEGHGALMYTPTAFPLGKDDFDVVVTGPRRGMFGSTPHSAETYTLRPYFPAPYGDMMITGCFGLLAATADVLPELAEPIRASLYHSHQPGIAPWDVV
ncbi:MAG: pyruvate formate lyase-activating protein [Anaerolineales bacterium]|nr:MAG: pyruvate formate lyase-activating protein [Anaerolineales bacterium]